MGHLLEMMQGSDKEAHLDVSKIPHVPEALELAADGILPEGLYRNRHFAEAQVDPGKTDLAMQDLLFDPQTSGGLLISVDKDDVDVLEAELKKRLPYAAQIGLVCEYSGGKRIFLE